MVRVAAGLIPSPAEKAAIARAAEQERFESARKRRNGGGVMLALGVPLAGVPTVIGWVRASRWSADETGDGTTALGSEGVGSVLLVFGTAATLTFAVVGTVLVVGGQRRMNRYGPGLGEGASSTRFRRFAGLLPLADREGRCSGLALRLAF